MTKFINDYSSVRNEKYETTYHSFNVTVKGNIWSVVISKGRFNDINVKKVSNNPFRTMGKSFESWENVFNHYKSPEMRNMFNDVKFTFEMTTLPEPELI